jgi:hypothetical protein
MGLLALVTTIALQLIPPKVKAQAAAVIVPVGAAMMAVAA